MINPAVSYKLGEDYPLSDDKDLEQTNAEKKPSAADRLQ